VLSSLIVVASSTTGKSFPCVVVGARVVCVPSTIGKSLGVVAPPALVVVVVDLVVVVALVVVVTPSTMGKSAINIKKFF